VPEVKPADAPQTTLEKAETCQAAQRIVDFFETGEYPEDFDPELDARLVAQAVESLH
jgi:hypothetical protein